MATLLEQAEVGPEPTAVDLGRNPWALAGRACGATTSRWPRSACSC